MPKYAVHMIVLEEVVNRLQRSAVPGERELGALLSRHREFATLGAIGPDLFFWAPDFEVVRKLYNFYANWKWLIDLYNATIGKVKDAIEELGEAVEDAVATLAPATVDTVKLLIKEIRDTEDLFHATLKTGLFYGVIEGYDFLVDMFDLPSRAHILYDFFKPPLQGDWQSADPKEREGKDEGSWYWFDMLHYRYTGKFAQNLVELADTDEERAYAYGYLTHIATDTVGHPFVNQIVGGPYRMHPLRHATQENFMDSWKFYRYYNESINQKLHEKLRLPDRLPTNLRELLYDAFRETYRDVPHPQRLHGDDGFLTMEDINKTYESFIFVSEVLGGLTPEKPEEPYSGVLDVLNEALKRFEAPPAPPLLPPGLGGCDVCDIFAFGTTEDSRRCYAAFAEAISDYIQYLGELIGWAFETILALIDFLLASLLSLPIMVVMAILYGIQMFLYNIFRNARRVLVLAGFVYPEPDEVFNTSDGRNFTTPYQCRVFPFENYPRMHLHELNNLQCPAPPAPTEFPMTASSWYPTDSDPDKFISVDTFDPNAIRMYAGAQNPEETRNLERQAVSIGNAIDLASWLITNAHSESLTPEQEEVVYTDWNLDSDRGYGYKCWKATLPTQARFELTDEEYI